MQIEVINSSDRLQAFCTHVAKQEWLALDTEFMRETTYYPNLCLIQIATDERIACIDTIAIDDLSAFKRLVYSSAITKVFHAASQDLEIFFNLYADLPTPIFDTQIAASALGYGEQISYARLVKAICGVTLDKSLSRTSWNRRPLSNKEIQYAVNDVKYLAEMYHYLKNELEQHGRSHWVADEYQRISNIKKYKISSDELWKSVKGTSKLAPHQLIVLKELAAWRDQQAIRENKPRQWILRDKSLRALCVEQPTCALALPEIAGLTASKLTRYADAIIKHIRKARKIPDRQWPKAQRPTPLNREQRKALKYALQLIRKRATELNVSPNLLATRNMLGKLIRGQRRPDVLSGWREELIGTELATLLEKSSAP